MQRRQKCCKTKHSGRPGAHTVIKQSILDAQAPKLLQNKAFWTPRRPNCYKTKHSGCKGTKSVTKLSILDAQALKLIQHKTFWTPRRLNSYKTKHSGCPGARTITKQNFRDAQAPELQKKSIQEARNPHRRSQTKEAQNPQPIAIKLTVTPKKRG